MLRGSILRSENLQTIGASWQDLLSRTVAWRWSGCLRYRLLCSGHWPQHAESFRALCDWTAPLNDSSVWVILLTWWRDAFCHRQLLRRHLWAIAWVCYEVTSQHQQWGARVFRPPHEAYPTRQIVKTEASPYDSVSKSSGKTYFTNNVVVSKNYQFNYI